MTVQVSPTLDRPVDAGRAFLGPDAGYYDEAWRVMAWRGRRWRWNGAAFLFGPLWLAWRRMHLPALAYLAFLSLLEPLAWRGTPPPVLAFLVLGAMTLQGGFGNALYLRHFARVNRRIERARLAPAAHEAELAAQGGTNPLLVVTAGLCLGVLVVRPVIF
ncbi:MAG: DUF2628 domain-containing protein [Geminicoccaceae bacterium]|nr:DUF2628 domain-containing protein [Geminicoccaceae bacterium]